MKNRKTSMLMPETLVKDKATTAEAVFITSMLIRGDCLRLFLITGETYLNTSKEWNRGSKCLILSTVELAIRMEC